MPDFLLELRSEEIPARMQVQAKADLTRLFEAELAKRGLKAASIEAFATPRRLALIARDLPQATETVSEELKGPRTSAPEQALDGFLRKTGLTRDALTERDGVWFANLDKPGRATVEVLAEAIPAVIRAFPWPKSMRWGAASLSTESLRWVRPLQGIVALLGETIVPCAIDGIEAGAATLGHRFVHPGPITIGSANDYVEKLRACHVIVHFSERCAIIRDGARAAAKAAGLTLVEDEGLVAENAGLTEWPVPLLGRFDDSYLSVPQEIIQLTARVNQKYFVCSDSEGKLANAFVCTANIDAPDGGEAIVDGNRKVLAARLADAKFFWDNDVRVPLEQQAEKLSQIVFHEKLGTVANKVERVAKLARWLCEEGIILPGTGRGTAPAGRGGGGEQHELAPGSTPPPSASPPPPHSGEELADLAERAARLCKADLVTGTVGEFPELQGVIGGHLARVQGEDAAVADAIRDHYKPVGQGDDVPTAPVTVAVSLADKLDTLAQFFVIEERPTGSKDPFALRRAALGLIALMIQNGLRISSFDIFEKAVEVSGRAYGIGEVVARDYFNDFLVDRLKVQQRDAGVRHDLIDAVVMIGGDEDISGERVLVRLLARVRALQNFVETPEGVDLLAGYKRAAKIVAQTSMHVKLDPERHETDAAEAKLEAELEASVATAETDVSAAIEAERFEDAMRMLASLKAPIYAFMDGVLVFHPNEDVARRRLDLLRRFRNAVHTVADFSKIEG